MAKEIDALTMATTGGPAVYVLGGAKVDDSVEVTKSVLEKGIASKVLVTGAVANAFLAASGVDIGKPSMEYLENNKYLGEIEIVRPGQNERLEYLEAVRNADWYKKTSELPPVRLAELTAGMTRVQLGQILDGADAAGETITREQVRRMQADNNTTLGSARVAAGASGVEYESTTMQDWLSAMDSEMTRQEKELLRSGMKAASATQSAASVRIRPEANQSLRWPVSRITCSMPMPSARKPMPHRSTRPLPRCT